MFVCAIEVNLSNRWVIKKYFIPSKGLRDTLVALIITSSGKFNAEYSDKKDGCKLWLYQFQPGVYLHAFIVMAVFEIIMARVKECDIVFRIDAHRLLASSNLFGLLTCTPLGSAKISPIVSITWREKPEKKANGAQKPECIPSRPGATQ